MKFGKPDRGMGGGTAGRTLGVARDLCLLLCLILTFLGLDSSTQFWLRWAPIPMAIVSILLTVLVGGGLRVTWIELCGWLGLGVLGVLRIKALKHGPIPWVGVMEAQDLVMMLGAAAAVWCAARNQPARVALVLVGAGLTALVTAALMPAPLSVGERSVAALFVGLFTFHPAVWMNPLLVMTQLNLILTLLFVAGALYVHRHGRNARTGAWAGCIGVAGLVLGGLAGCLMARTQMRLELPLALPLMHGMRAIEDLWAQSALTGWGHRPLPQLIAVMAEPRNYLMPVWCGPLGGLAVGGVVGAALMILGTVLLLGRSQGGVDDTPTGRYARRWAVIPALMLLGLAALGGIIPTAAWYFPVIWAAVAMGGGAPLPYPAPWRRWTVVAGGGLWMGGLTFATVWFGLLSWGSAMARSGELPPADEEAYRSRLNRAAQLNPYDSAIPSLAAMSWQRTMTAEVGWNERNFGYVLLNWDRAIQLHPYDTRMVMHKAEFLMKCERFNAAVETIEAGLKRRPNDSDLLVWIYLASRRAGRSELAYQMLDKGLDLDPSQLQWWYWRWEQAGQFGQGPLTSQSMAAALSRHPEQPALVAASWRQYYMKQQAADVPTVPGDLTSPTVPGL